MKPDPNGEAVIEAFLASQRDGDAYLRAHVKTAGYVELSAFIDRALMEAERRSQQEIDRLLREIDHKQKAMSSQAEQWTRSMAEARREGMEEAMSKLGVREG